VVISDKAHQQIARRADAAHLQELIVHLLELDPRPAYKGDADEQRVYGIRLYDFDLRWRVTGEQVEVVGLESLE
jgi:hypothetical protein